MTLDLRGRDFLKEVDFTATEFEQLLDLAAALKIEKKARLEPRRLTGRNIALIFAKTSTRTRCAFEVAAYDQGMHVTFLDPQSSQLGHKESVADTARVLARFYDAIEFRGSAQATVEELALAADVPVYNGLTDEWHPTQMLADFLTMREHSGKPLKQIAYAYLGDARSNMGNSLLVTGALLGSDVRIAAPRQLWPSEAVQAIARDLAVVSGARILITEDPGRALPGADFVHTDVWVSLGEPPEVWVERVAALRPYRVSSATLAATGNPQVRFMHCLPAFHNQETSVGRDVAAASGLTDGLEVTSEVFDSAANIAFDQAENRLHTIKAVLVATLAD